MDKRIQDELNTLTNIIVNTVPVKKIFLFGSYVNGTPNEDSDLDILVLIPESADIREIDAMKLISKAIRDKKTMPVDIVVSKENRFYKRQSYYTIERQISQEGNILYG